MWALEACLRENFLNSQDLSHTCICLNSPWRRLLKGIQKLWGWLDEDAAFHMQADPLRLVLPILMISDRLELPFGVIANTAWREARKCHQLLCGRNSANLFSICEFHFLFPPPFSAVFCEGQHSSTCFTNIVACYLWHLEVFHECQHHVQKVWQGPDWTNTPQPLYILNEENNCQSKVCLLNGELVILKMKCTFRNL